MDFTISENEKRELLYIARRAIADNLRIKFDYHSVTLHNELFERKLGAFVTLHLDGDLRGCIGYITGVEPLYQTIEDMALSAAFRDPRFAPLSVDEFKEIDIEISERR